jgi:hypothetical protein
MRPFLPQHDDLLPDNQVITGDSAAVQQPAADLRGGFRSRLCRISLIFRELAAGENHLRYSEPRFYWWGVENMKYTEFQKSEFHGWFGIGETGRVIQANGLTRIALKPGGFQEFIDLYLEINAEDEVKTATLLVDRSWFISPSGINMMGIDIVKSFVNAMIPDTAIREPLVQAIWDLSDRSKTLQTFQANASSLDPALVNSLPARLPGLSMTMITASQPAAPIPMLRPETLHVLLTCLGIEDKSIISAPSWSLTASNDSLNSRVWLRLQADFK